MMDSTTFYSITLHLNDVKYLFQEADPDPFLVQDPRGSGIDQLISEFMPLSLTRKVRTTIVLPRGQVTDNIEQSTGAALHRYCDARIHEVNNELTSLRWEGIKSLQTGLIFLAVCLVLSALFDGLAVIPEFLRQFLSQGFLIAGWVSLWHPIELLLYGWWPLWRNRKIYQRIRDMELRIVPQD
jgi:hypothetical protein